MSQTTQDPLMAYNPDRHFGPRLSLAEGTAELQNMKPELCPLRCYRALSQIRLWSGGAAFWEYERNTVEAERCRERLRDELATWEKRLGVPIPYRCYALEPFEPWMNLR